MSRGAGCVGRGQRPDQERGHIILYEGGQQCLEDIQDVAPVRAQLSGVGACTAEAQACYKLHTLYSSAAKVCSASNVVLRHITCCMHGFERTIYSKP